MREGSFQMSALKTKAAILWGRAQAQKLSPLPGNWLAVFSTLSREAFSWGHR
jgi:hypothetical protein